MTLNDREKLAFAIGSMIISHWVNFGDFNYNSTFFNFLDKVKPNIKKKDAIAMNNELKIYMEELDYLLAKGMQDTLHEHLQSQN